MNRILSLQFYLVSSSFAAPWPGPCPCNCETLITAMATQTPFPKGCWSNGAGTYSADTAKGCRTTFSGGTALNVNCRTTFQAHETFNHHVSDSQSQQTELTYITRIQTLIIQIIQKP